MPVQLVITEDGSSSLFVPELDEHYHSVHGALQESMHVFIQAGLEQLQDARKELKILEVGLGTGLNALLTLLYAKVPARYTALEAFPIAPELAGQLNYPLLLEADKKEAFGLLHSCVPGRPLALSPSFIFTKHITKLENFRSTEQFDLVYFDAFAPRVQPELWTKEIFGRLFEMMEEGGALVTYCAKGEVKRNLKAAGFKVEPLPGPKGKREMTRAVKASH
jgi:tRNA U34 5-methylaminomethyl-2-thiouridine-forming methyltransferase MnmC